MIRRFLGVILALGVLMTLAAPAFAAAETEPAPAPEYRLTSVTYTSAAYMTGEPVQIQFSYDGGGWLPTAIDVGGMYTIEATYDEGERALTIDEDLWKQTFAYDEAGSLLEKHSTMYDDPDTVSSETVTAYTYNENGDELSYTYSRTGPGEDPSSTVIRDIYDDSGMLVGEDWEVSGSYTAHIDHAYNEQGDESAYTAVRTYEDGTEETVAEEYEYTYDDAGNMIDKTTLLEGVPSTRVTYAYDEQGRRISEITGSREVYTFYQPLLAADWECRMTYSFDESGNVIGATPNNCLTVHLGDTAGNLLCEMYLDSPETPVLEYDGNGYLVRASGGAGELLEFAYEPVA